MIHLEHVSKTFAASSGDVHAVKDVTLDIRDGEIFGIIGFSGAGKSTLVRCINLLERPTSGRVVVADKELMKLSEKELREVRKKIGMIFQHFNLMKSRTVFQNIAFPLKGAKLSQKELENKIASLLKLVGLEEKRDAYPSQLSGGQKQRVAIARALANDPKVLLCDEATSALDPQTTKSILKLLKKVNEELGITIVLITHEMGVIKEICDRVAVMEQGHVAEQGSVLEVFTDPQAEVSRNFIASTNNLQQVYELAENGSSLTALKKGELLVRLHYGGTGTGKPLISEISRRFQVDTNIIFGNVEIIQHVPLGDLVLILSGEKVEAALSYLREHEVDVEVIASC